MVQLQAPPLDTLALADDLREVHRIYARFFITLDPTTWDTPSRRGRDEWTLHEAIAHLCALNGAGLESIEHALRDEPYIFRGLETRFQLGTYNRAGIDAHLNLSRDALCAEFLRVHDEVADIARVLQPAQAQLALSMPIYNRPVQIVEALGIIMMHAGLVHTAQVADPAGVPPLWMQLSPDIRHRTVGRVMRAFSLLYRHDIGDPLRARFAFHIDGPGGGNWFVNVSPEAATSGEGLPPSPNLVISLSATDDFCRMLTVRFNPLLALVTRRLKLSGDLRLFLRMSKLFSPDTRA